MPRGRPRTVVEPCRYCSKQFKRREHLQRHERTHTKEKPFTCDCGQSFTRQDLLTRHARVSHPPQFLVQSPLPQTSQVLISDEELQVSFTDLEFYGDLIFEAQDLVPIASTHTLPPASNASPDLCTRQPVNFSRFSSRLPSLDECNDDVQSENDDSSAREFDPVQTPWSISRFSYESLCVEVQQYAGLIPVECSLTPRETLVRYIETYLQCPHESLPFIHRPTFSAEDKSIELLLAIAATGALYRFEYAKSHELYVLAKTILMEKRRRESLKLALNVPHEQNSPDSGCSDNLERTQTFLLLLSLASFGDNRSLPDSMCLGSQLSAMVRESGISQPDDMPQDIDWLSWVLAEERRRTLLAVFVLFNLQSILFKIPPLILYHEVDLCLPSHGDRWMADNEFQWQLGTSQRQWKFRDAIRSLFDGTGSPNEANTSAFSCYLMIHGILQQVYVNQHGLDDSLQQHTTKSIESALHRWQLCWESAPESSLNPFSHTGLLGIRSTALFRLAYIRLAVDLGTSKGLASGDLQCVAEMANELHRSPQVDRAIIHAAHALSVPVRIGIQVIANSKTPTWGIENSLCSLECALLLKNWLKMIEGILQIEGAQGLRKVEKRIVRIISSIIRESGFIDALSSEEDALYVRHIASIAMKLWAHIFQGAHTLQIDNLIKVGLQALANSV